jgi:hypothetical protein
VDFTTTSTQPSYRIDTLLVDPLAMLPINVAKSGDQPDNIPTLAYRNLLRGSQFQLPSGQNVARALGGTALSDDQLWDFTPADSAAPTAEEQEKIGRQQKLKQAFAFRAPLWFYILKESELTSRQPPGSNGLPATSDKAGGHFLGPVGGQIVAEVLVGILWHDHTSYLYQDSRWTPAREKEKSGFNPGATLDSLHAVISWVTGGAPSL